MWNLAKGLSPLCGSILAVAVYAGYLRWWWLAIFAGVGLLALVAGRVFMSSNPFLSGFLLTFWIMFGVALLSIVTLLVLWVSLHSPTLLPGLASDERKELAGVLIGAVTAFAGVLFTKNIDEGGGPFWPGTQFKQGVKNAFELRLNDNRDTIVYDAVLRDRVRGQADPKLDAFQGWGFRARLKRAQIIKASLLNLPAPKTPDGPPTATAVEPAEFKPAPPLPRVDDSNTKS